MRGVCCYPSLMFPPKLKLGDTIRVIAPSSSYGAQWITDDVRHASRTYFEDKGYKLTFGKYIDEMDDFGSTTIEHRLEDLHDAFADSDVKLILCARGGFNGNQLIPYLNYDLIASNPKILCGFSDITALANAIYAKTGMVTYSGPNYSHFGREFGMDYTTHYFEHCLMKSEPLIIQPSKQWGEYAKDNANALPIVHQNAGWHVFHEGTVEGTIIGGNLCTLNLLQGSPYFPDIRGSVLFLEDDFGSTPTIFDRDLTSVIHQPGFGEVRGMVIGRFEPGSGMTIELLEKIIESKRELKNMPIIAKVDFGHTRPMITFPIGGTVRIVAGKESRIEIVEH